MSATGDTIAAIQHLLEQLRGCVTSAGSAVDKTDQARSAAANLGNERTVAVLDAIGQSLAETHRSIDPLIEKAQQALGQAQAIEDGV
jgi:hypothetical protein